MRLTDRPKKLLDMRPDIVWPPNVQAVLDKALERDVNQRYQTAAEFGRDLNKAVSTMRGSAATRVMSPGSLPPTAVPPDLTHGGGGVTKPIPATRVSTSSTPKGSLPAIPPERRSRTPMIATLAAVAVLAAGSGGYFLFTKNSNADARSTAEPPGDTASKVGAPVVTPVAQTVTRELDDIYSMPDTNAAMGRAILDRLNKIDAPARASDDSTFLQYRYMLGKALMASGAKQEGCDTLSSIQGKLEKSPRFRRASKPVLDFCAQ